MKKIFFAMMFALALSISSMAADVTETEPNNDYATANTVEFDKVVGGVLETESDVDVFTFTITEPTNVSVTAELLSQAAVYVSPYIYLLSATKQYTYVYLPNDHMPHTSDAVLLSAGTYYLKLFGGAIEYTFFLNHLPLPVFNITYKLDDGTLPNGAITTYTQTKVTKLPVPTRTGYTFEGWSWNLSRTRMIKEIPADWNGDKTLNAEWIANKYPITYKLDGGKITLTAEDRTYTYGYSKNYLKAPTRKGYIFKGWFVGKNLVEQISSTQLGAVTLTAKWTAEKHTITYSLESGDKLSGKVGTYTVGKGVTNAKFKKIKAKRKGYIFKGWKLNGKTITSISKKQTTDLVLVPKWKKKK